MTAIARDVVASDHLVYAWPFPLGPECEVTCAEDEQVVMCPAYLVGDRLGPGRHRWRTPDPMRPVMAFFVLTSPVEVSFDLTTSFVIPATGQPVRVRAVGSIQVQCIDPGLLIAQFVGLPFDNVNAGVLRSVSRSVERMLGRLLTRRVVMAASPVAVTDPGMLAGIVDELVAYNPTAGAVFGVEPIRMGHLSIAADDGSTPYVAMPAHHLEPSAGVPNVMSNGDTQRSRPEVPVPALAADIPLLETARGHRPATDSSMAPPRRAPSAPTLPPPGSQAAVSGEIKRPPAPPPSGLAVASGEIVVRPKTPSEPPVPRAAALVEVPRSPDEITQPGVKTPVPGSVRLQTPVPGTLRDAESNETHGSIMGIGVSTIGASSIVEDIPAKVPPGSRVLVPGPNGLMQSATVRQLLQGYYELEVGSSGQTIWVPMNGVVPE